MRSTQKQIRRKSGFIQSVWPDSLLRPCERESQGGGNVEQKCIDLDLEQSDMLEFKLRYVTSRPEVRVNKDHNMTIAPAGEKYLPRCILPPNTSPIHMPYRLAQFCELRCMQLSRPVPDQTLHSPSTTSSHHTSSHEFCRQGSLHRTL